MSEASADLDTALAGIAQRVLDGVDATVEFSQAQVPDVLNQLLWWNGISSFLGFCLLLLFAVALVFTIKYIATALIQDKDWAWYRYSTMDDDPSALAGVGIVLSSLGLIVCFIGLCNTLTWLKILIAPKLYILEYAMEVAR